MECHDPPPQLSNGVPWLATPDVRVQTPRVLCTSTVMIPDRIVTDLLVVRQDFREGWPFPISLAPGGVLSRFHQRRRKRRRASGTQHARPLALPDEGCAVRQASGHLACFHQSQLHERGALVTPTRTSFDGHHNETAPSGMDQLRARRPLCPSGL